MIACSESTQTAPLLNVQQPFERAHEEGGSKGPRWYSDVNGKTGMQDGGDADVHPWALSPANVTADSAVGPPVLRSEQQGILRRDTTQHNTINVEPPQLLPNNSERLSYPDQPHLNYQLKDGGHEKNQATMQDPQVVSLPSSSSSCTKLMPKQQQPLSLQTVILPQCANSAADGARNELQYDNTHDAAIPPLLLQHNEDARFPCHTSRHEQLPQQQTGHSVAATLPPKYVPSSLVSSLSAYECDGINEVLPPLLQPQRRVFNNSDGYVEDIHFQCMTNPDNPPSTLPSAPQCDGPFQPYSNVVVEVQNNPYRSNCNDEELQHYHGDVGVLLKQHHEEYHHPERRYDVNVNNNIPSSAIQEQQQQLEDDCHDERMRYAMVDNNLHLPHDQHSGRSNQLYNQLPKIGHEQQQQRIEKRTPKPEQYHPHEMRRNVVACNPNLPLSTQEHQQQFYHPMRSYHHDYDDSGALEHVEYPENGCIVADNNKLPVGQKYAHDSSKRNHHEHTTNTTTATTTQRIAIEKQQPDDHNKRCVGNSKHLPLTDTHQEQQQQQQHYYPPKIINHEQQQHVVDQRYFSEHQQPEGYNYREKNIAVAADFDHDLPMVQEQQQQHYPKRNNLECTIQGGIRVTTDPPEYHGRKMYVRHNNVLPPPDEEEYCYNHNSRKYNSEPQNTAVQRFTEQRNNDECPYPEKRFVIVDNECPTMEEQEQQYHHSKKNCEPLRQHQPHEVITGPPEYHERRRYVVSGSSNNHSSTIQQDQNYDGGNTQTQTERWPESVAAAEYTENRYGGVPRGKTFSRSGIRWPTPPPAVSRLGGRRISSRTTGMQQQQQQQHQGRNIIRDGLTVSYNEDRFEDGGGYWVSEDVIGGGGDSKIMHHTNMNPPPPPVIPCRPRQGVPCEGGRRRKGRNRYSQNNNVQNKGRHLSKGGRNDHHQYYRDGRLGNVNDESQYVVCNNEEEDADLESDEEPTSYIPLTTTPTRGSTRGGGGDMRIVAPPNVSLAPDFVQSGGERETAKTLHEKLNALESGLEHVEASMSTSTPHHHLSSSLSKKNSKEIQQRLLAVEMAVNGLRKESLSHGHDHSSESPEELLFYEHGSVGGASAAAAAPDNNNNEYSSNIVGSGWALDVKDVRQRLKKARNRLEKLQMEAEAFSSEATPSLKSHVLRNQRHRLNNALNMALGSSYS